MARKITVSHKTGDKMVNSVTMSHELAKSVRRKLAEYSQNMTLEDLSTSNSFISIDILVL